MTDARSPDGRSRHTMSRPLRTTVIVAAIAVAIFLLFTIVFPWVDRVLIDDPVLQSALFHAGG